MGSRSHTAIFVGLLALVCSTDAIAQQRVPYRIRVGAQSMRLIHRVPPSYPDEARKAGIHGTVRLTLIVSADGSVREVLVISGESLLRQPVLDAARQWRFERTLLNGEPVETVTTWEVIFDKSGRARLSNERTPEEIVATNEASAIASLIEVFKACQDYSSRYHPGFPDALSHLGWGAVPSPQSADMIDYRVARGRKDGYRFVYTPGAQTRNGRTVAFTLHAEPIEPGTSGKRYFYVDQTGVIRAETLKRAASSSPPLP